jgi:hypothetical protein
VLHVYCPFTYPPPTARFGKSPSFINHHLGPPQRWLTVMAKGFMASLKGVDAFGKVRQTYLSPVDRLLKRKICRQRKM